MCTVVRGICLSSPSGMIIHVLSLSNSNYIYEIYLWWQSSYHVAELIFCMRTMYISIEQEMLDIYF